ncbi:hypothetical protein P879_01577 [Paragonimus westermani]|uniref:Uncharacterized protein n=1 Tax=Paragonimus westermani TaxID=34504 RepID=A0A8T0DM88_9TREM|nr:hypothetical protein P879_01577 [Paragonimus westermani]
MNVFNLKMMNWSIWLLGILLGFVWMNSVQSQVMDEMDETNMPYASWTYSKRWSPVKEFHQLEPIEVRRRAVPLKRWSPVKEFHYPEPFEVKKRPLLLKRWSPVKEFHYPEPVEVKKRVFRELWPSAYKD